MQVHLDEPCEYKIQASYVSNTIRGMLSLLEDSTTGQTFNKNTLVVVSLEKKLIFQT